MCYNHNILLGIISATIKQLSIHNNNTIDGVALNVRVLQQTHMLVLLHSTESDRIFIKKRRSMNHIFFNNNKVFTKKKKTDGT